MFTVIYFSLQFFVKNSIKCMVNPGKLNMTFVWKFLSQREAGGPRQRLGKVLMDGPEIPAHFISHRHEALGEQRAV